MKFVFRVDATLVLGSGHIMRSMSLAHALHQRGAEIVFAVLHITEYLKDILILAGYEVKHLPLIAQDDEDADASATLACTQEVTAYVLDHYNLGARWELLVKTHAPVLALDDLGRAHDANWVLDQNFYAQPQMRYVDQLSTETKIFLGPIFALLRPEFEEARRIASVRDKGVRKVLVFLGGMDANNVTSKVLQAIEQSLPLAIHVTVIAGASHPTLPWLHDWCARRGNASLHLQVNNMAKYLLAADLAVGAGGSSTWERCACGLPSVTLCIADNQKEVIQEGMRAGFLWGFDAIPEIDDLADVLRLLQRSPSLLEHMSQQALRITDGRGAKRIADILMPRVLEVRVANLNDARKIYDWRSNPSVQKMSRNSAVFSFEDHCEWLIQSLSNPARVLLIGQHQQTEIGVVRFDIQGSRAEVSIFLAPDQSGEGLGGAFMQAAEDYLCSTYPQVRWVDAWVKDCNQSSMSMFNRLGYITQISCLEKEIA